MITKEYFAHCMDHSVLGADVKEEAVIKACNEAVSLGFGAVSVSPCFIPLAKSICGDSCGVGATIGFPWGSTTTAVKIFESLEAIGLGANELDMVMNVSKLKDGDTDYVRNELSEWVKAVKAKDPDCLCKVIIECFFLTPEEKKTAIDIVCETGCDYVKQTTGTTPESNYTFGDVLTMVHVADGRCKIKASGWMMTVEDAIACIEAGCERVGNDRGPIWLTEFDNCLYYERSEQ